MAESQRMFRLRAALRLPRVGCLFFGKQPREIRFGNLQHALEAMFKSLILRAFCFRPWHGPNVSWRVFFRTAKEYLKHCLKHAMQVGAKDCPDYENRALDFLTKPATPTLHECSRKLGDLVRYDSATDEFAIFSHDGFIRSYFKPTTATHGMKSNLDYFKKECLSF